MRLSICCIICWVCYTLNLGKKCPAWYEASTTIDMAYSNQLVEHLHPDDIFDQTKNILNILKNKGRYVCITPNKLSGPHDISKYFDDVATGFHLKEYTTRELIRLQKKSDFQNSGYMPEGKAFMSGSL